MTSAASAIGAECPVEDLGPRGDVAQVLAGPAPRGALGCPPVAQSHRRAELLARLQRSGWPATDAAATVARIEARHADDDRRTCAECRHYRPSFHRCHNHRCAGLMAANIGRDLAGLHQRCFGFEEAQP